LNGHADNEGSNRGSHASSSGRGGVPSLSLRSGALSQGLIVAFESAADAEFVATSLRVGMARRAGR
jgi:hypothetical protein